MRSSAASGSTCRAIWGASTSGVPTRAAPRFSSSHRLPAAIYAPPGPGTPQTSASTCPAACTGSAHVWRPTIPSALMPASC